MCKKRLSILLAVLLVLCFSVSAFPGVKSNLKKTNQTQDGLQYLETQQLEIVSENLQEIKSELLQSEPESSERILPAVQETKNKKERTYMVNADEYDQLISDLETIEELFPIVAAENATLKADIAILSEENGSQADALAFAQGALVHEKIRPKFFVNVGGLMGFKDYDPIWGVTGNLGVKLNHGLLVSVGTNYMIGSFKNGFLDFNLDNFSATATIGWEF